MKAAVVMASTIDMMVVECENVSKHGIPTGWAGSREFKLDDEELFFMNTLPTEEQKKIWDIHFGTGRCVACLIDERRGLNRSPSQQKEIEVLSQIALQMKTLQEQKGEEEYHLTREETLEEIRNFRAKQENHVSFLEKLIQLFKALERCISGGFHKKKKKRAKDDEDDF